MAKKQNQLFVSACVVVALIVVLALLYHFTSPLNISQPPEYYSFNADIERILRQQQVDDFNEVEMKKALDENKVQLVMVEDGGDDGDDGVENFRWRGAQGGRYRRRRYRDRPHFRYWKFPYHRFVTYPYYVQGPARWVRYDGDYYYVTV